MKRTLLAVRVAVLISMMLVPQFTGSRAYKGGATYFGGEWQAEHEIWRQPVFYLEPSWDIEWDLFALQTAFAAVVAAVLVNIPWRRNKKRE